MPGSDKPPFRPPTCRKKALNLYLYRRAGAVCSSDLDKTADRGSRKRSPVGSIGHVENRRAVTIGTLVVAAGARVGIEEACGAFRFCRRTCPKKGGGETSRGPPLPKLEPATAVLNALGSFFRFYKAAENACRRALCDASQVFCAFQPCGKGGATAHEPRCLQARQDRRRQLPSARLYILDIFCSASQPDPPFTK